MSNKKTSSKIASVIVVIAIVLVLALVAGFIARFTNNFTTGFKTFYVEYDGKTITTDTSDIKFLCNYSNRVNVGYSLEFLNKEKSDYNVQVLPNVTDKTDFEYTVDEATYLFSDIEDLTKYFEIEKHEDYFIFQTDKSLSGIMQTMYAGQTVTGIPQGDDATNLLKLVVSTADNSISLNLAFTLYDALLELEPDGVVFWD